MAEGTLQAAAGIAEEKADVELWERKCRILKRKCSELEQVRCRL